MLEGWGRHPRHASALIAPSRLNEVAAVVAASDGLIARGNGRAYGDAALGERTTLSTLRLDRIRSFDRASGRIRAEAGLLLADLIDIVVPQGFFPPVVPGTKFVTLGGMAAADVHGKNHHRDGGFGEHVEALVLALPDGAVVTCSREENPELFAATIGGMGLTGTILEVAFRLVPIETGWLRQTTVAAADLQAAMAALAAAAVATYTVAWIDCLARGAALGRSLVYAAEPASRAELEAARPGAQPFPRAKRGRAAVPFDLPSFTLNRLSVGAFNELYYRRGAARAGAPFLVEWDPFFFPLDSIGAWNRIYGRRGFLQYQCVVPAARAHAVLAEILDRTARHGSASFLAVLKQLGPAHGHLSFPQEGFTLALDIPVTDGAFALLDSFDDLVREAGGRVYLAKDARQSRAMFESGYPDLPRLRSLRRAIGAEGRLASRLSNRLGI